MVESTVTSAVAAFFSGMDKEALESLGTGFLVGTCACAAVLPELPALQQAPARSDIDAELLFPQQGPGYHGAAAYL